MHVFMFKVRTSTYQRAILSNRVDFEGKVVIDIGTGSGILSFFAAHAGARKVYAIDASDIAKDAATLVRGNRLEVADYDHAFFESTHLGRERSLCARVARRRLA